MSLEVHKLNKIDSKQFITLEDEENIQISGGNSSRNLFAIFLEKLSSIFN